MWNFKGTLWNSTQTILTIHWKMCILFVGENLRVLRLRARKRFWNTQPHILHKRWLRELTQSRTHTRHNIADKHLICYYLYCCNGLWPPFKQHFAKFFDTIEHPGFGSTYAKACPFWYYFHMYITVCLFTSFLSLIGQLECVVHGLSHWKLHRLIT